MASSGASLRGEYPLFNLHVVTKPPIAWGLAVFALNLGEAAVIGAVASVLLVLGAPAALAAAAAPLLVKKFILPAKDELCAAWSESIAEGT